MKPTLGPTDHAAKAFEKSADLSVGIARKKSDDASLAARKEADASRIFGTQTQEEISRHERRKADDSIRVERLWSDEALISERSLHRSDERIAANELSAEKLDHAETRNALASELEQTETLCHDLRNPIGAIATCTEMLLTDLRSGSPADDLEKWLTFIKRNADTAVRLAANLLDDRQAGRTSAGAASARHDVDHLMEQAVQNSAGYAAERAVQLRAVPGGDAEFVECDQYQIMRVLSNLIDNAVKFASAGGSVQVTRAADGENAISLAVVDDGPGIAEGDLAGIFDRFTRTEGVKRPGNGLGLHIAKTIVEAHGGVLKVVSTPGVGSVFSFSLPKTGKSI